VHPEVEVTIASYGIIMSCEAFSMSCGVGIPLRTALWAAPEASQLYETVHEREIWWEECLPE